MTADDHDDERQDEGVHAHAQHSALLGNDDGAAQPSHKTT